MKKQNIKSNTPVIVLVSVIMAIIGMSFRDTSRTGAPELPKALLDTPKKKSLQLDIDLKELHNALNEINIELKGINWDKISNDINVALNSINVDKIKTEVNQSIKAIDWEKIKTDVNHSLKNINVNKIKIDIKKATDDIKVKINSEEFKNDMKRLEKIDTTKLKQELRKAHKELEKNKEQIRSDIEKMNHDIEQMKIETDSETTNETDGENLTGNIRSPEKDRLFFLI